MEQLARKDPFALRRHTVHCSGPTRSVLNYIRRAVSTKDYQEVDEGANVNEDGEEGEILPDFGSEEERAKNYRWALLELVSGHRFLESLRSLGMGAGIDTSDTDQGSSLFLEVMSALEHRTAILQTKLDGLDIPVLEETAGITNNASSSHVVRGLFKVISFCLFFWGPGIATGAFFFSGEIMEHVFFFHLPNIHTTLVCVLLAVLAFRAYTTVRGYGTLPRLPHLGQGPSCTSQQQVRFC